MCSGDADNIAPFCRVQSIAAARLWPGAAVPAHVLGVGSCEQCSAEYQYCCGALGEWGVPFSRCVLNGN